MDKFRSNRFHKIADKENQSTDYKKSSMNLTPQSKIRYLQKPFIITFAFILLLMGIWIIFNSVTKNKEENPLDEKTSILEKIRNVVTHEDGKIKFSYDGNKFSMKIPRSRNGLPAIPRAILVDADNHEILYEYHGNSTGQIASVTKLMLMYYVYSLIDSGVVSLSDTVYVTDEAPLMGGSQAYLDRGERYSVEELLKAIAIGSANDAAYLMAQYVGHGSVISTIRNMNSKAREMGLKKTKFYNVHGLPPSRGTGKEQIEDGIIVQRFKRRNGRTYLYSS